MTTPVSTGVFYSLIHSTQQRLCVIKTNTKPNVSGNAYKPGRRITDGAERIKDELH